MPHQQRLFAIFLALACAIAPLATLGQVQDIDIPYKKFVLKNGLTLLVHEDRKAPIVAVNIWYHVGSKNEKPGKTGFAHLFEHLMFNGSENFNDDYFQALERLGATDLNGTTNVDRTNYFQNVPTSALDTVLWLESDRMGHMVGAIDQAKLDEQRGVVKNEKRQGEDQPYGKMWEIVAPNTYAKGHPYSWTTIGSMEDLDAASLDDVKEWFKSYYGAANAVLVVAGDIDAEAARAKVEKYFGDIPAGPPVDHPKTWIAKRSGEQRVVTQDRVPQARVMMVWNVPEYGTQAGAYLDLLSDVLGSGKTSRLYKRLVYTDQIATDAASFVSLREIGGQFLIQATARPGVELAKVESALREELAQLLAEGPSEREMQRVRTQFEASFVRGIERIGGFGGKSDILAMNQVYLGNPDFYKTWLGWVRESNAEHLRETGKAWLADGVFTLEVHPFPDFEAEETGVDRSKMPEPGEAPTLKLPTFERSELSNGLKIMLAERHDTPQVLFDLVVNSGHAADSLASPGTAKLAMAMIDEGTAKRDALELTDELALLGAQLSTDSGLDAVSVSLSALKKTLEPSLDLFAEVVLSPTFPESEFKRVQQLQLDAIRREKMSPIQAALRVFPQYLFGEQHPYGNPYSGAGTEDTVARLTPGEVRKFHQTWFKPNNATLVVVGDTTMAEIKPKLERLFGGWKRGAVPDRNIPRVELTAKPRVYLIDKPGATQSVIVAGHVAPPTNTPQAPAIDVMNAALGGMFTSRVNMNLREEKHWTYGARSLYLDAVEQRPFLVYTAVQADKTSESMVEIQKELLDIAGRRPLAAEELAKAQANLTLELPGSRETLRAVRNDMEQITTYGLPDDYFQSYPEEIRALTPGAVLDVAQSVVHPNSVTWVVVGDLSKIRAAIEALGLGDVTVSGSAQAPAGQ
ncbi:MAG: insulinase family protein [Bryobacterales bacterium]|nr:insulinase family protein [Bryobacterales bacterium]